MRVPKLTPAQVRDLAIAWQSSNRSKGIVARPRQLKTGARLWALGLVEVANPDRAEYENRLYVITPRGELIAARLNLCDGEASAEAACSSAGRGELGSAGAPPSQPTRKGAR